MPLSNINFKSIYLRTNCSFYISKTCIGCFPDILKSSYSTLNHSSECQGFTDLPKKFKVNSKATERKTTDSHVFSNIYPWRTVTDLSQHLLNSLVYHKGDLVVISKPYGVAKLHYGDNKSFPVTHGIAPTCALTLKDCEGELKRLLGVEYLEVVICPERWCSGFTAISLSPKMTKKLENSHYIACHSRKLTNRDHIMICYGEPQPSVSPLQRSATQLVSVPGQSNLLSIIPDAITVSKYKRKEIRSMLVEYETLSCNSDKTASLVQVKTSSNKNHSQRVWLSHHLSPVLGDSLYGNRVARLMGSLVKVPYKRAPVGKPVYPLEFLQKLDLTHSSRHLLPIFSHCRSIRLPSFFPSSTKNIRKEPTNIADGESSDESELKVYVPMPSHFIWTLEKLGVPL